MCLLIICNIRKHREMRKFLLIIFGILLISCENSIPEDMKLEAEKIESEKVSIEKLTGKWYLNKWTYYHTLDIKGDNIDVDNHVDSVFFLNYRLSHDTLITWSENSKKFTKNKILKVSKDTLIFESFLNTKGEVHYSKTEREIVN